jgi:hypothetical protein
MDLQRLQKIFLWIFQRGSCSVSLQLKSTQSIFLHHAFYYFFHLLPIHRISLKIVLQILNFVIFLLAHNASSSLF